MYSSESPEAFLLLRIGLNLEWEKLLDSFLKNLILGRLLDEMREA